MEDSGSYHQTGIPCGDRRRYGSRGVTRMSGNPDGQHQGHGGDAPIGGVLTEAERHLQKMLQKQLDTNVTLEGQLSQHKTFTEGATFKPFVERAAGELSLEQFSKLQAEENELEYLRHCGLSEDEIALKLQTEGKEYHGVPPKRSKLGMDPVALQTKLSEIEDKIKSREEDLAATEPESFSSVKVMSRHEMEIENSLYRGTEKANVLSHLTARGKPMNIAPDHPINHLQSITETLFSKSRKHPRKTKCQKSSEEDGEIPCPSSTPSGQDDETPEIGPRTKEGTFGTGNSVQLHRSVSSTTINPSNSSPHQHLHEHYSAESEVTENVPSAGDVTSPITSRHGQHVDSSSKVPAQLQGSIQSITENQIVKNRLSIAEIRNIPRFKDYTPGQPNKVLYLKNLPPGVTEFDLIAMFIRYQQPQGPKILFRLLTGRMKGQAFVTFDCAETAGKALEMLNGYKLKGRPVIIQYGQAGNICMAELMMCPTCPEKLEKYQ